MRGLLWAGSSPHFRNRCVFIIYLFQIVPQQCFFSSKFYLIILLWGCSKISSNFTNLYFHLRSLHMSPALYLPTSFEHCTPQWFTILAFCVYPSCPTQRENSRSRSLRLPYTTPSAWWCETGPLSAFFSRRRAWCFLHYYTICPFWSTVTGCFPTVHLLARANRTYVVRLYACLCSCAPPYFYSFQSHWTRASAPATLSRPNVLFTSLLFTSWCFW